jgi:hypothetical protein
MKMTHFSAESDEENNYFTNCENIFILTVQNASQVMSNSYVIITESFRLRITVNFFPNTLNNKDHNDKFSSLNVIRVNKSRTMRWEGCIARMEERRGAYGVLVRKPEGKRPRGRPRRR